MNLDALDQGHLHCLSETGVNHSVVDPDLPEHLLQTGNLEKIETLVALNLSVDLLGNLDYPEISEDLDP